MNIKKMIVAFLALSIFIEIESGCSTFSFLKKNDQIGIVEENGKSFIVIGVSSVLSEKVKNTFHIDEALDYDSILLGGSLKKKSGEIGSYYTGKAYQTPYGYVLFLQDMTRSNASLTDRVIVSKSEFSSLKDFMDRADALGYSDKVTPITLEEYFQLEQE